MHGKMTLNADPSTPDVYVAIPTCNRAQLLKEVLNDLMDQEVKPKLVVVVDSSDQFILLNQNLFPFQVMHLKSDKKSAAFQRNISIDIIQTKFHENAILIFLDDDVKIQGNYIKEVLKCFQDYPDVVGVSGITEEEPNRSMKRSFLTDWIGASGTPGKITRSAINIPVRGEGSVVSFPQWLIGCSSWRIDSMRDIRFEADFMGNSIFEDVIFSFRMSKLGRLMVLTSLKFNHHLSEINRKSEAEQFKNWVINRRRILKYDQDNKFNRTRMLVHDCMMLLYYLSKAIRGHSIFFPRALGILRGLKASLR
jgi:GT2 family glycosyltransferase